MNVKNSEQWISNHITILLRIIMRSERNKIKMRTRKVQFGFMDGIGKKHDAVYTPNTNIDIYRPMHTVKTVFYRLH